MRILFIAQYYAPEDVSAAVLITEPTTDLARRGHADWLLVAHRLTKTHLSSHASFMILSKRHPCASY